MAKNNPKPIHSKIWCGTYYCGTLGWLAPDMIAPNGNTTLSRDQRAMLYENRRTYAAGDLFRCKITIQPLKDKRGRFIVKRHPRKERNRER